MQKILITNGLHPIAQRIGKLLKEEQKEIFFCESNQIPAGLSNIVSIVPQATSATYTHELLKLCLDKDIDMILPLEKEEIEILLDAKILFEEYGIQLLADKSDAICKYTFIPRETKIDVVKSGQSLIEQQDLQTINGSGAFVFDENVWKYLTL